MAGGMVLAHQVEAHLMGNDWAVARCGYGILSKPLCGARGLWRLKPGNLPSSPAHHLGTATVRPMAWPQRTSTRTSTRVHVHQGLDRALAAAELG